MQISLADETVRRVQAWTDRSRGLSEDDVIKQAFDCFERTAKPGVDVDRLNAQAVVERFRRHRGLLAGVTIDNILGSRHKGPGATDVPPV